MLVYKNDRIVWKAFNNDLQTGNHLQYLIDECK